MAAAALLVSACGNDDAVVVGSKDFVEQEVLGELLAQELEARGMEVERRFHFAGTNLTHQALVSGEIDLYVEYSGTALMAVLDHPPIQDPDSVRAVIEEAYLDRWDLVVRPALGFENTFAFIVRADDADSLALVTIGDLRRIDQEWTAGFGPEFMERPDGYAGIRETYGIEFGDVRQMDLGLLYRALSESAIDVAVGNSTDGQIAAFDLRVLVDDRGYFPPYQAVPIVRREVLELHPPVREALAALEDAIDADEMRRLNAAVISGDDDIADVVRRWRASRRLITTAAEYPLAFRNDGVPTAKYTYSSTGFPHP